MEYKEIIQGYSYEQLCYEQAILNKEESNLYIKKKELKEEFERRLNENRGGNNV